MVINNVYDILLSYIKNPEIYWENNERQANKSKKKLNKLINSYNLAFESLAKIVIAVANERINDEVPTIYVSSLGSSGSHLLQHVMVNVFGCIGLGEIYLPPKIERMLSNSDDANSKLFVESYHLLHSSPDKLFSKKEIINTAHKAKLQGFSSNTARYKSAFLLRNPVDICISRTFRKGEYRNYLGKGEVSDMDYLMENINRVRKFYKAALNYPYDQYFFYEELLSCNYNASLEIAKFFDDYSSINVLNETLREAVDRGATNKYSGPPVVIDESYYSFAESELSSILDEYYKAKSLHQ